MKLEPDAIKQAESDLAAAVGVPVRYSGDKWQWQIGDDWRDVPDDSAKTFDATAKALSVPIAAANIRYNPKTKRYHSTEPGSNLKPMVSAELAAYTYDATARANEVRQSQIDMAQEKAANIVVPTAASDAPAPEVEPVAEDDAAAPVFVAPVKSPKKKKDVAVAPVVPMPTVALVAPTSASDVPFAAKTILDDDAEEDKNDPFIRAARAMAKAIAPRPELPPTAASDFSPPTYEELTWVAPAGVTLPASQQAVATAKTAHAPPPQSHTPPTTDVVAPEPPERVLTPYQPQPVATAQQAAKQDAPEPVAPSAASAANVTPPQIISSAVASVVSTGADTSTQAPASAPDAEKQARIEEGERRREEQRQRHAAYAVEVAGFEKKKTPTVRPVGPNDDLRGMKAADALRIMAERKAAADAAGNPLASDVSLSGVAAHNMGMASAQKAAGAAKVQRTGKTWQVQSGDDWKAVGADDAATLQTAYTTGAATPPNQPPGGGGPGGGRTQPGATGGQPPPSAGFQVGSIIGGQIRNLAGGLLPAVGAGAAAYAVHRAGSESESAVRAVVGGASSVIGEAMGVGKKIGMALLDAALSPFGASGRAVASMASGVADAAVKGTQGLLHGVGNVLGTGAKLAGSAAGIGLGLAGGAVGAVAGAGAGAVGGALGMGPGGALLGAASTVLPGAMIGVLAGTMAGAAIASALSAIGDAIGGVLGAIGSTLGVVGELGSTALKGLMDTVKDLADTAEKFGAQMSVISSQTGLSTEKSGAFSLGMNALGLGATASAMASGPNANPMMAGMTGAVFGLGSQYSPDFQEKYAQRFQTMNASGPLGQMMAQGMAKTMGMDTPEARRVAMIDPSRIREQRQFATGLASGIGLDVSSIKKLSDDLYLLQNRASSTADIIKMRLAQELLPYAEQALKWVSDHAADIVGWVKKGVSWIITDLPPLMLSAGAAGMRAASGFMESLAGFVDGLADAVPAIAESLDRLLGSLLDFGDRLAGIADTVSNAIAYVRGEPATAPSAAAEPATTATSATAPSAPESTGLKNPPPPPSSAAAAQFDMADIRTAIQLKSPPQYQSGIGQIVGTVGLGLAGAATAARVSRGNRYAVGVGAAVGAAKGYKEGTEYDEGGESRFRVVTGLTGAAVAAKTAWGVSRNPLLTGGAAIAGYEGAKHAAGSPRGQTVYRAGVAVSNVTGAIVGDGKPTTGNAAAPGSYQDRYRLATQPLRDFSFQKFATDKDISGRLHSAADAIQRGADKLASGADTLDEWGRNYKPMTPEAAKEKAADAQQKMVDLMTEIRDGIKHIKENPAMAMTMRQVSQYIVNDETQGFLRGA